MRCRLQDLGLVRFPWISYSRSFPISTIFGIGRQTKRPDSRRDRSRNMNNCVVISPGEYGNSRRCIGGIVPRMTDHNTQLAKIPVRVTQRIVERAVNCKGPYSTVKVITMMESNNSRLGTNERSASCLLSFYMANARSVSKKHDELTALLLSLNTDVAVITESWLNDLQDSEYLSIPGYSLLRRDRPDRIGGGVCAFVSSTIPLKRRSDLECSSMSVCGYGSARVVYPVLCLGSYAGSVISQKHQPKFNETVQLILLTRLTLSGQSIQTAELLFWVISILLTLRTFWLIIIYVKLSGNQLGVIVY